MGNWKLKSCPRCEGDLYVDRDYNGWYAQCLQCGYTGELRDIANFEKETTVKDKVLVHAVRGH